MRDIENQNISPAGRPVVLRLLCIITFVTGFFKIALLFWALFSTNPGYSGKNITGLLNLYLGAGNTMYILIWISLTLIAMAGTWQMWKLKKNGFYIYVSAVSVAYLLPAISSGSEMMTIQRLFFTSIFIFMYGIHLKFMN